MQSPRDPAGPMSSSHLHPFAALQQQEVTTLENVEGRAERTAATARSSFSRTSQAFIRTYRQLTGGPVIFATDRDAAEEQQRRGRGETHGSGLALLHDRAARSRRGCGRHSDGVRAGGFHHLPDRAGEAEEGHSRGRRR